MNFVKLLTVACCVMAVNLSQAQVKGKSPKGKATATADTTKPVVNQVVAPPTDEEIEAKLYTESLTLNPKKDKAAWLKNDSLRKVYKAKRLKFYVKTKKPLKPTDKMQLCYNLVYKDTNLKFCVNDSICKDPEVTKVLFEQVKGDTNYVLVYVDAFTKSKTDRGAVCGSGHETKLTMVRWNIKTNQAKWKNKIVSSCYRTITNMTKTPIVDWDKSSVLTISYHKGSDFIDVTFDPAAPEKGLQSNQDNEK